MLCCVVLCCVVLCCVVLCCAALCCATYYVCVHALTNSSFSIVASFEKKVENCGLEDAFKYYYAQIYYASNVDLSITVTPTSGLVNLFVGTIRFPNTTRDTILFDCLHEQVIDVIDWWRLIVNY